jgi:phage gp36-like protein
MAGYCTEQGLIGRFGEQELIQLTDRANTGAIDSAVVTAAINMATADINSYIGRRYALPLSATPDVLQDKCELLARYRLYENGATDQVRRDYEDAIKWLEGVRDGKNTLGTDADDSTLTESGVIVVNARDQVFTNTVMGKY